MGAAFGILGLAVLFVLFGVLRPSGERRVGCGGCRERERGSMCGACPLVGAAEDGEDAEGVER
ncbi:MAG: hypothetical protein HY704_02045 [Gemmatimonadetes bacterium]|nr:hypothetical protein [Gemmatimonadota bacterium]